MVDSYRQLAVLARAIHFQNLSTASQHVGLSQPQLSRVIAQLEQNLGVVLLDRSVRRRTHWTPVALQLAEMYEHTQHRFRRNLQELLDQTITSELKAGCLEGLSSLAVQHLGVLGRGQHWRMIHLDVLDQTELEERFLAGALDVIWTSRVPGKGKPRHVLEVGWQNLEKRSRGGSDTEMFSNYQFAQLKKQRGQSRLTLVSNSLRVRELWLANHGGSGVFPTEVKKQKERGGVSVVMLGSDLLAETIWAELCAAVNQS